MFSLTTTGIDISPTACRVMAKRRRDVCALPESEPLWRAGRGFVVRDLPWPGRGNGHDDVRLFLDDDTNL